MAKSGFRCFTLADGWTDGSNPRGPRKKVLYESQIVAPKKILQSILLVKLLLFPLTSFFLEFFSLQELSLLPDEQMLLFPMTFFLPSFSSN